MAKKKPKRKSSKKAAKRSTRKTVKQPEFDVGKLSFFFGVLLSVFVGILLGSQADAQVTLSVALVYVIIFVLGIIVGFMNISVEEVNAFLIAAITFLVASGINVYVVSLHLPVFGAIIKQIFNTLSLFVAPAATIVALKAMYFLARK